MLARRVLLAGYMPHLPVSEHPRSQRPLAVPRPPHRPRIDLTGQRFGHLVAIERAAHIDRAHSAWRCRCDCGTETIVQTTHLTRDMPPKRGGLVRSCALCGGWGASGIRPAWGM